MAVAAALVGSALIGSTSTIASSLGAAKMQADSAASLSQKNIDFQKSVIDRGEKSYSDAGLPKFAFWGGQSFNTPNTLSHLGGSNYASSYGVNANLPYYSTQVSQWSHLAKPLPKGGTTSRAPTFTGARYDAQSDSASLIGQNDRLGLGFGRYNTVAPPSSYSTNSAGMNTERIPTSTRYSQTGGSSNFDRVIYPTVTMPKTFQRIN